MFSSQRFTDDIMNQAEEASVTSPLTQQQQPQSDDIMNQAEEASVTSPLTQQQQPQSGSGRQPAHRHDLPDIAHFTSVPVMASVEKCKLLHSILLTQSLFCVMSL